MQGAKEATLENTDWSYDEEFQLLRNEIKLVADQCRSDETKKMINQTEASPHHDYHAGSGVDGVTSADLQATNIGAHRNFLAQRVAIYVGRCPFCI